jgi:hypothetical protein
MTDVGRNDDPKEGRLQLWERLIYAVPLIGWMIKDVVHGEPDNIYHFLFAAVCLWIIAGLQFGAVGVVIPALVFVPVIFLTLVLLTRG